MTQGTEPKPKDQEEQQPLLGELIVSTSPHIHTTETVEKIMWTVAALLVVPGIVGVWVFGMPALIVILLSVGTAIGTEALIQKMTGRAITIGDGSAVVTGLLFAYSMSPLIPWYVTIACILFAIGVVKHAFGGLGNNIWNPAMAGRAFGLAAWTTATVTIWVGGYGPGDNHLSYFFEPPAAFRHEQAVTGSTPRKNLRKEIDKARNGKMTKIIPEDTSAADTLAILRARNDPGWLNFLFGSRGGSIGETCILALVLGGIVLIVKKYINWQLPAAMIGSALFFGWMMPVRLGVGDRSELLWFSGDILFDCLSGGLILGAFFIATDMVSCPMTKGGQVIFGLGIGFLMAVIRLYAGYPEGVSYAVILMNTATPLIDRFTKPKVFGAQKG